MWTRSKRKRVFAVVRYHLACWLNMVVCQPHLATRIKHRTHREHSKRIWRDFRFLSEAFYHKNNSDFSTTLPSVWSSLQWKCRPEMGEMAWKLWDINQLNENFRWKANKSPFAELRRYRGRWDLRHASRRWWRQRLQKGRQCKKLTAHFFLQVNVKYEVCNFRQAKPKDGETFSCFHTRPRSLAKTCDFTNPDKEIKEHIILNSKSNSLRRKALREALDLSGLMKSW